MLEAPTASPPEPGPLIDDAFAIAAIMLQVHLRGEEQAIKLPRASDASSRTYRHLLQIHVATFGGGERS